MAPRDTREVGCFRVGPRRCTESENIGAFELQIFAPFFQVAGWRWNFKSFGIGRMPELLQNKIQAICQVQTLIFVDVDGVLNVPWMQEFSGRWILEMNSSMKKVVFGTTWNDAFKKMLGLVWKLKIKHESGSPHSDSIRPDFTPKIPS